MEFTAIVTDIQWDDDNEGEGLPSSVQVKIPFDCGKTNEDFISEYLSNEYDFLVQGFNYELK